MLRSSGIRFLIVGLLALLMFIPLFFVGAIIDERADYSRQTARSIGAEWGGAQEIVGPHLIIPVEGPVTRRVPVEEVETAGATTTGRVRESAGALETVEITVTDRKAPLYVFPDKLTLDGTSETSIRSRGIFEVPVYNSVLDLDFDFDLSALEKAVGSEDTILWSEAQVVLGVSNNRALRGEAVLRGDDTEYPLDPRVSSGSDQPGVASAIGDPRRIDAFSLSLGVNGAGSLHFTPVARTTTVTLQSDWPHPSFTGAFLPDSREITEDGFTASWVIPHLARNLPQISRNNFEQEARNISFGVQYYEPNDFYQKTYRAARYGILIISLTFLTVLLIEGRSGKPAHPVQYILIGLAQSLFVLLMVAYAEQIGFGPAYLLSSAATIGLLTLFGATALKLGKRAAVLGALLTLLYAVLYLILRSTDYALLAGATLAFAALAGTMIATRNEDWYGPPRDKKPGGWFIKGQSAPQGDQTRSESPT
ncbi:cell envelope integrity protein CreD [Aestuariibius insulae]|uniref:cell envelope integrity protein CreD n=1 Tax=Aestuariibius insulae TaxID=2058287 RepID=UPI00345E4358